MQDAELLLSFALGAHQQPKAKLTPQKQHSPQENGKRPCPDRSPERKFKPHNLHPSSGNHHSNSDIGSHHYQGSEKTLPGLMVNGLDNAPKTVHEDHHSHPTPKVGLAPACVSPQPRLHASLKDDHGVPKSSMSKLDPSIDFPAHADGAFLQSAQPLHSTRLDTSPHERTQSFPPPTGLSYAPLAEPPSQPPRQKNKHKGWPKGKPRGKKATGASDKQTARSGPKKPAAKHVNPARNSTSVLAGPLAAMSAEPPETTLDRGFRNRARSFDGAEAQRSSVLYSAQRQSSLPATSHVPYHSHTLGGHPRSSAPISSRNYVGSGKNDRQEHKDDLQSNICEVCQCLSTSSGYHDQWIGCNGCKRWFHTSCVGIKNEREVRDIDKFYCESCEVNGYQTTHVRKSARAHASLDYAGLNEGEVRTATDTVDHHYIQAFKAGTIELQPETFPRMKPELVTADFFQKSGTMTEPVLIPAEWNPRPSRSSQASTTHRGPESSLESEGGTEEESEWFSESYDYDCVPDDGQDKMDMVMPGDLTVRTVAELVGPDEKLEVIDVKSQEGGDNRWNLRKWADYYEAFGEKPVRNVISLEVSHTRLGRLVRRPKIVRDLDLQDAVWPQDELDKGAYPRVQFYCLMSVKDCYTDFHIDFGGSSVYYHVLKGSKTFFFIPPKKQHLKAYEQWCNSANQGNTFLGDITKECYRVDLFEGDTMLIPSGWIHAVWTPSNSLVIGGNFLTRMHYGMQIAINDIEKATGVGRKFRYPSFQKVLWYAVVQYLQEDPVPSTVAQTLYGGFPFERPQPTWDDFDAMGPDDPADCHARYYSKGEIDGLTDLMRYIFRTVMISLGKVPGISKTTQEAVVRALPKGYGDHVDLLKTFALWCAWKRGNEELPPWAYPDFPASDMEPVATDKKPPNATTRKTETSGERRSARVVKEKEERPVKPTEADLASKDMTNNTPKSAPGPRRIACEACRKRRTRCKHKDPEEALSPGSVQRFGIKAIQDSSPEAPIIDSSPATPWAPVAVMIAQPSEPVQQSNLDLSPVQSNVISSKVKACDECRKSKRRCVHDEMGNVDPVKASQTPVPRAYSASKRARADPETDSQDFKRPKLLEHDSSRDTLIDPSLDIPESMTNMPAADATRDQDHTIADHLLDPSLMDVAQPGPSQGPGEVQATLTDSASVNETMPLSIDDHLPQETSRVPTNAGNDLHMKEETNGVGEPPAQLSNGVHHTHVLHSGHNEQESKIEAGTNHAHQHPLTNGSGPPDMEAYQNGYRPDNRSRTPSLRVKTNSSESNAAGSVPSSPLTELEPSSPVQPHTSVERPKAGIATKETPRQTSIRRYETKGTRGRNTTTPKSTRKTPNRGSTSATPVGTTSSRRSTGSQPSKGRSASKGVRVGTAGSPTMSAGSPTLMNPEEDASMRLIRQMQEQEFGLRRR